MPYDRAAQTEVSATAYARLKARAERKPVIGVMGEFSVGKSSLLNFLLDGKFLPTQVTATTLPPVWISYGDAPAYYLDEAFRRCPVEGDDLLSVPASARVIRIFLKAELLETVDLIDTPGISDPGMSPTSWQRALGYMNMVIWCTSANQAWRQTERSTWNSLPARLHGPSVLLMTRADKLVRIEDREKVLRRLERETAGQFAAVTPIATPKAVVARHLMRVGGSADGWADSGAEALYGIIAAQAEVLREAARSRLERYVEARQAPLLLAQAARPEPTSVVAKRVAATDVPDWISLRLARRGQGAELPEVNEGETENFQNGNSESNEDTRRDLSDLPMEVRIWREIAMRAGDNPDGNAIISMIDQLLVAIAGEKDNSR